MAIIYDSKNTHFKTPFGAVPRQTEVFFHIHIRDFRHPQAVRLFVKPDEGEPVCINGVHEWEDRYAFCWKAETPGLYFYQVKCDFTDHSTDETPWYQLTVYQEDYETPSWLREGLMYQIFPDRFARDPGYEVPAMNKDFRFRKQWGALPESGPDEKGIVWNNDFFGGNLRGIIQKLPYLQELGVTVLYLNPIFEAFSNHRYDTANYKKIDPMLGTEEDFATLCRKSGSLGIRIILDGVFNHTGSHSIYFNKDGAYGKAGAYQSRSSPYYSWFRFFEYPDRYDSWWGIDTLPSVNETDPGYLDYILRDEDSVVKHWLRLGASGFRLDVADELPDEFLDELRRTVRSVVPDGAVIGEVWEDASNKIAYGYRRKYFQGGQLDTVMNYPVKEAIIDFVLGSFEGERLKHTLESLWENYPRQSFYTLMNILGTHDTPRVLTVMAKGRYYTDEARQRLFLAVLLWAFIPGIPCLYYGDEIGMEGGRDPMNRCCFQPEKANPDIYRFFRRVLRFRKQAGPLTSAPYVPGGAGYGYFSFERQSTGSRLLVIANSSPAEIILAPDLADDEYIADYVNCGWLHNQVYDQGENRFLLGKHSGIVFRICKRESREQ